MCPALCSTAPDVLAAILSPSMQQWTYPLLALLSCSLLFGFFLWQTPRWARKALARHLGAVTILLVAAEYTYALTNRWSDLLLMWHNQTFSQPGFLSCQISQVDSGFYGASRSAGLLVFIMVGLAFLAQIPLARALNLYRVGRASARQSVAYQQYHVDID